MRQTGNAAPPDKDDRMEMIMEENKRMPPGSLESSMSLWRGAGGILKNQSL
ncbi:MAG: hypothetical protein ACI4V0_00195 [Lachnospiraceae bacterium]